MSVFTGNTAAFWALEGYLWPYSLLPPSREYLYYLLPPSREYLVERICSTPGYREEVQRRLTGLLTPTQRADLVALLLEAT